MIVAVLPSWLKVPIYRRLYGYDIGRSVRIGLSPFIGVRSCRIGDHVKIGSFNVFYRVNDLQCGDHARVGFLNLFRGGDYVKIGRYVSILRQNVFNAIIESDFVQPVVSLLDLGVGAVVTSGHWLDFSAGLVFGDHTIIGGRNSSFWTHNRQRGRPVTVGRHCYLGSEIRVAPGVDVPPFCIVALGSVLAGRYTQERSLIGGNLASVVKALREDDLFLIVRKTRNDMPDDVAYASLPDDLRDMARRSDVLSGNGRGGGLLEPDSSRAGLSGATSRSSLS